MLMHPHARRGHVRTCFSRGHLTSEHPFATTPEGDPSKDTIPPLASSAYFSAWNQLPGDSNAESVVGSDMDLVPLARELRDAAALGGGDGRTTTTSSTILAPLRKTDLMFLRHLEDET